MKATVWKKPNHVAVRLNFRDMQVMRQILVMMMVLLFLTVEKAIVKTYLKKSMICLQMMMLYLNKKT